MTEWVMNNLLLTGAGAGALIFIIMKIIPNEKIYSCGEGIGIAITAAGRRAFGKEFYEKIEYQALSWGGYFIEGLIDGLQSDKDNGKGK